MVVNDDDYAILCLLLEMTELLDSPDRSAMESLRFKLARAAPVRVDEMPGDVVTINTIFLLKDLSSGYRLSCILVFPWNADSSDECRLSVFSPLGVTVLGHAVGDVVVCRQSNGIQQFRIEDIIFQPESVSGIRR